MCLQQHTVFDTRPHARYERCCASIDKHIHTNTLKQNVLPRVDATANKCHRMQDGLVPYAVQNYCKTKTEGDSCSHRALTKKPAEA